MFQTGGLIWGISWIWYLVGILGVGGVVALAILAPAIASMILQWCLRFFLGTRIGVGLLVGAVVFMGADIHRSRLDEASWKEREASFEHEKAELSQKVATDTRNLVMEEQAIQAVNDAATDKRVEDFSHELPPVPATGNPFAVGPDACRLRQIAGLSCRRLERASAPMPKPHPARKPR